MHKGFIHLSNEEVVNTDAFAGGGYIQTSNITEVFQNEAGVWIHTLRMNICVTLSLEEVMRIIDEANA